MNYQSGSGGEGVQEIKDRVEEMDFDPEVEGMALEGKKYCALRVVVSYEN